MDGEVKTQAPFNLRPVSSRASKKRGNKMATKGISDCKKQATQRTEINKQNHLQHSGAYTKTKVSVHHNAAVMTPQTLSSDTFLPVSQVYQNFYPYFSVGSIFD